MNPYDVKSLEFKNGLQLTYRVPKDLKKLGEGRPLQLDSKTRDMESEIDSHTRAEHEVLKFLDSADSLVEELLKKCGLIASIM